MVGTDNAVSKLVADDRNILNHSRCVDSLKLGIIRRRVVIGNVEAVFGVTVGNRDGRTIDDNRVIVEVNVLNFAVFAELISNSLTACTHEGNFARADSENHILGTVFVGYAVNAVNLENVAVFVAVIGNFIVAVAFGVEESISPGSTD